MSFGPDGSSPSSPTVAPVSRPRHTMKAYRQDFDAIAAVVVGEGGALPIAP
jgi:hypothetical protein